ncbi:MAG TPA: HD-GYP domain-containing protein [Gaiellales bacterium]|nr:HD-GYP domain-containing protein [Gaiellales bacterium]
MSTARVPDGALLGRDVRTGLAEHAPLLRAGTAITPVYRNALIRQGINAVYIDDELSAGIEVPDVLTERTRNEAESALQRAYDDIPSALGNGETVSDKAIGDLKQIAHLIARDIAASGDAVLALTDLAGADAYTLQHSIDVTVLGLVLGRRVLNLYGWPNYRGRRVFTGIDERLTSLGVGLLLHDIGKLVVPSPVLQKQGPLDADEWELMRQHPVAGVELLPGHTVSALAKSIVRSHHERWDGSGYPDGRAGSKIAQFARIASVADVYDAVTSARPYRAAAPAHVGYQVIVEGAGTAFDPEVVAAFRKLVAPYPAGTEVELADGSRGIVAALPSDAPDRPTVRITHGPDGTPADPADVPFADLPPIAGAVEYPAAAA